jgi:orotidine-5'-phosphate decarboxylase
MSEEPRTASYRDQLGARVAATGSALCLGLDPDPTGLPAGFEPDVAGIEAFARLVLEAALPCASAVKANLAFFEAYGAAGLAALERLRARIPAGVPFIADAKRGDIGSTASRQAVALFDALGADAVTLSPYLGWDALEPFLARPGRGVYVLCRTSNPAAGELQDLHLTRDVHRAWPAEPLFLRVARQAAAWVADHGPPGTLGLVVGATAPAELRAVRDAVPQMPFLVPGVGAQGGDVASALAVGATTEGPWAATPGGGLLVNVSRAIASAAVGAPDPGEAIAAAARSWAGRLRCYDSGHLEPLA